MRVIKLKSYFTNSVVRLKNYETIKGFKKQLRVNKYSLKIKHMRKEHSYV